MKEQSKALHALWAKMGKMKEEHPEMSEDEILKALFLKEQSKALHALWPEVVKQRSIRALLGAETKGGDDE